jgi:hypothetical protein
MKYRYEAISLEESLRTLARELAMEGVATAPTSLHSTVYGSLPYARSVRNENGFSFSLRRHSNRLSLSLLSARGKISKKTPYKCELHWRSFRSLASFCPSHQSLSSLLLPPNKPSTQFILLLKVPFREP